MYSRFCNISPYVRRVWDHSMAEDTSMFERVLFDYELIYIKSGNIKIQFSHGTFEGGPGCLFIIKPNQNHIISFTDAPIRQPHIHFDFYEDNLSPNIYVNYTTREKVPETDHIYFRENILDTHESVFPEMMRLKDPDKFEALFFRLLSEFEEGLAMHSLFCKGIFIELWSFLLRELYYLENDDITSNIDELTSIKQFLDNHYNRSITLDELSKQAHISKYHLSRLFKKHYGITINQYHIETRLLHAKNMLLYSNHSVSEISDLCGFGSIHSFSRLFKKKEKISPTHYRNLRKNKEEVKKKMPY